MHHLVPIRLILKYWYSPYIAIIIYSMSLESTFNVFTSKYIHHAFLCIPTSQVIRYNPPFVLSISHHSFQFSCVLSTRFPNLQLHPMIMIFCLLIDLCISCTLNMLPRQCTNWITQNTDIFTPHDDLTEHID